MERESYWRIGMVIISFSEAHRAFKYNGIEYHFHQKQPAIQQRDENTGCMKAIFHVDKENTHDIIMRGIWTNVDLGVYEDSIDGDVYLIFEDCELPFKLIEVVNNGQYRIFENTAGVKIRI